MAVSRVRIQREHSEHCTLFLGELAFGGQVEVPAPGSLPGLHS